VSKHHDLMYRRHRSKHLGIRWRRTVCFSFPPLYPRRNSTGNPVGGK